MLRGCLQVGSTGPSCVHDLFSTLVRLRAYTSAQECAARKAGKKLQECAGKAGWVHWRLFVDPGKAGCSHRHQRPCCGEGTGVSCRKLCSQVTCGEGDDGICVPHPVNQLLLVRPGGQHLLLFLLFLLSWMAPVQAHSTNDNIRFSGAFI